MTRSNLETALERAKRSTPASATAGLARRQEGYADSHRPGVVPAPEAHCA